MLENYLEVGVRVVVSQSLLVNLCRAVSSPVSGLVTGWGPGRGRRNEVGHLFSLVHHEWNYLRF